MPLEEVEKTLIVNALQKYGSSYKAKQQIAKLLGISLATLYNKILKYKLVEGM